MSINIQYDQHVIIIRAALQVWTNILQLLIAPANKSN